MQNIVLGFKKKWAPCSLKWRIMVCNNQIYSNIAKFSWKINAFPFNTSGRRLKGEVRSRITIISKERVKISLQIGAKNYENRIRNKEVMAFWNFTFFQETFLDQSLWIFKWASWWCHALTIFHMYCIWNFEKILIFSSYW